MKLRELQEMIEKDSDLSIDSLDQHSLETAKLQSKYFKIYSDLLGESRVLDYELSDLKKFKYQYYSGACSPEVYKEKPFHEKVVTNAAKDSYVVSDPDVLALQKRIDMVNIKLEVVKDMKKALEARNWQIRNAIEFIKFKNGM